MRADRALMALHGAAIALSLVAATAWPRPGQAALLVPVGGNDLHTVLRWMAQEDTAVLALDTARGRVIVRISDNAAPLHALAAGIVPLTARAPGCTNGDAR
ncbi:MAG: hypothetical protein KAF64_17760 [Hydrogenophaga sp.]|uniref:hypothetical protein n=1 Tax=Hydrogenophaga sp. TaxID=1904254 RepID=UPI0025C3E257|nr:hypothetical protein [Hydrogenophaga sp.]MBU7575210.1 hypothetical protein [Hydrogenophaga sp.]